ncbi:uncharacterized protein LOC112452060 isoform X2 [Temnothorax curvispinosus]|uniref:Uncharacterized protein LOC112452060 isoform X2 n=1 Tax=Temnothorax curvispinosus TaxID=300111 RepID=A0A6J1PEM2_9HYME|nr:uncharacterized protein LOC112452060 isoform X2 [Temnothorax curvispinosus]
MSSSNFALDAKRHELYKSGTNNKPVILDGSLFIRDKVTDVLMMIPDTLETRQFFNLSTVSNNSVSSDADETSTEELIRSNNLDKDTCDTQSLSSSDSAPVKWTDANAVRSLISKWKNHESDFKNTKIRNSKVWQMIADDLKEENPLWSFNGIQCENKFKDVRKSYTKVKDHNNQSGAELKTYKFYEEMEAVLGEKPIVKPISISSTLKKRVCPHPERAVSPFSSDSDEKENSNRKKSKIAKELDKWSEQQRTEAKKREQARMQRHKEKMERQDKAIEVYKEQMEKLLEKL